MSARRPSRTPRARNARQSRQIDATARGPRRLTFDLDLPIFLSATTGAAGVFGRAVDRCLDAGRFAGRLLASLLESYPAGIGQPHIFGRRGRRQPALRRAQLQFLEQRIVLDAYTWIGGSGDWGKAAKDRPKNNFRISLE